MHVYIDTGDASDRQEDRTHNEANEILDYAINGGSSMDYAYDNAGNLYTKEFPTIGAPAVWTYTHDAWNRLVKVEARTRTATAATRATRRTTT